MDIKSIETHLHNGLNVKVTLKGAKVVSSKTKLVPISHYRSIRVKSLVVVDPEFGAVYLTSSSDKIRNAEFGDLVFGKVVLTGIGEKNAKFDAPIKFSKVLRGKEGEIKLEKRLDD